MNYHVDKSRFLITTADERTWRLDGPVLFLGEWCRLYNRKNVWEEVDAEVASPYGWDPGQRERDYAYVQKLYQQALAELSETLNEYHCVDHSLRYWRILIGPWLWRMTGILFNRWMTLQLAANSYEIDETIVLNFSPEQIIPKNTAEFLGQINTDILNHLLFGRMLLEWFNIPCRRVSAVCNGEPAAEPLGNSSSKASISRRLRRFIAKKLFRSDLFSKPTDLMIISSCLPLKSDFHLQLALKQFPKLWTDLCFPNVQPCNESRRKIKTLSHKCEDFEQCLRILLVEQIPTVFVEGYNQLLAEVEKQPWPKKPRAIFTSSHFDSYDVFKAWTANKVETGVPYIIGQHGGNYGVGKFAPSETHEVSTADRYLTWGWTSGDPKHYPTAIQKVIGLPKRTWDPKGGVLLVQTDCSRYSIYPWDTSPDVSKYLEDQFKFVDALSARIRNHLTVRLHYLHKGLGYCEDKRWFDKFPSVNVDLGLCILESLIRKSRLFVYTYNSTGYLETFARNIPTIIFWNPNQWPLRNSAVHHFELLKEAGIFFENPEEAAAKIVEIWDDVQGWWDQSEIQEARHHFCQQFARMPDKPIRILRKALTTFVN